MSSNSSSQGGFRKSVKQLGSRWKATLRSPSPQPPPPGVNPQPTTPPPDRLSTNAPGPTAVAILSQNPGTTPRAVQTTKDTGNLAWIGLEAALRVLKDSSDVFPPLKSAFDGLLSCLELIPATDKRRQDYAELASNLATMVNDLAKYTRESNSAQMSDCVSNVINALQEQINNINERQQHRGLGRYTEAEEDAENIIGSYRLLEAQFRQLQNNAILSVWSITYEQLAHTRLESMNPARQAFYDSGMATGLRRRRCTPNTRELVLEGLRTWTNRPDGPKIYWMNGMAGTGKTTIACSICAELKESHQLAASFFCSRALPDCREVVRILPTIAYQLARFSYPFQAALCRVLGNDPDISTRGMVTQFQKLINEPLLEVKDTVPPGIVVTVDALDECSDRDGARQFLDLLFRYTTDLPIKFFVTGRPETGILDTLLSKDDRSRSVFHLHDIEQSFVRADVETYLNDELASVSLSKNQIKLLAERAGSLFIYAATVVRYIKPGDLSIDPRKRLDVIIGSTSKSNSKVHRTIDALYTTIISAALEHDELESWETDNIKLLLQTVICAMEPLTTSALAGLLGLDGAHAVLSTLQPLRSVLHVSENNSLVSPLHASFPDYILSRDRSRQFHCNQAEHSQLLVQRCFDVMRHSLRFNICDLESSFAFDEDVPDLLGRMDRAISPQLFYACRYWGEHLVVADMSGGLCVFLERFLEHQLLYWMEVLNLKQCIHRAAPMLFRVQVWLQNSSAPVNVYSLVQDAWKFVTVFSVNPVSRSTPHIYVSMLRLWPKDDPVWVKYHKNIPGLAGVEGTATSRRNTGALAIWTASNNAMSVAISCDSACIVSGSSDGTIDIWGSHSGNVVPRSLQGHASYISSVAFSPDGARVVSGSNDNTIIIWDTYSGNVVAGPLQGHTANVQSVAFSPDGARVVSGSWDKSVRIWDAQSGNMVAGPFEGHKELVTSVAFSPDGARVVSGSNDHTVRIWDSHRGELIAFPFEGHASIVTSVAFSPEGDCVVSGSDDNTVCIWDLQTGNVVSRSLQGHAGVVRSVVFLPDGARVASCCYDGAIRIWDLQSGNVVAGPLQGHSSFINSVVFSSDGARVVSGVEDHTVRIWDAHSLYTDEPFKGHTGSVNSVAFSPDGARVVSGSDDNTIIIWDTHCGDIVVGPLLGHTNSVGPVAFSPDGARVVSGSRDKFVRVWDARSGDAMAGHFEGHISSVTSVAFSPDGARVASGSSDSTIRIWDAKSGNAVAGPFRTRLGDIISVAFSPDGARIASSSSDRAIRIWDAQSGNVVAGPFKEQNNKLSSVAFSPDGARVVSGSRYKTIHIWDAQCGAVVAGPFKDVGVVTSVAFSPDGARVVSGGWDKFVRILDAQNGDVIAAFEGHTGWVNSVAFSPDGTRVASSCIDHTIRIWDVQSQDVVAGYFKLRAQDTSSVDTLVLNDWTLDKNGWILGRDSQPLLWVPLDLRTGLKRPQNTLVIYNRGSLVLQFDEALLGPRWRDSYCG